MKTYMEEDKIGKHKVIEHDNGIKVRILREPSEWYKEKQRVNAEKEAVRQAELQAKQEQEKLIKDKMRELAIAELTKEGKL